MKKYNIELSERFKKEFRKLDKFTQKMIRAWITKNIYNTDDPRTQGKDLAGDRKVQWQYRIGDYRLIYEIVDNELLILALTIGHRKEIYDK